MWESPFKCSGDDPKYELIAPWVLPLEQEYRVRSVQCTPSSDHIVFFRQDSFEPFNGPAASQQIVRVDSRTLNGFILTTEVEDEVQDSYFGATLEEAMLRADLDWDLVQKYGQENWNLR